MSSTIQADLITSIRAEDTQAVLALLEAGADVNAVTVEHNIHGRKDEITPLTIAAQLGNATLIQCLLEHGADISQTTDNSLHLAWTP